MFQNWKTPIWFYRTPVDFRKQIDGLVMLIADHLSMTPSSGQLFLFRNRQRDKIKLLWYDQNGFWLCYKRLEKGKLKFPSEADETIELTQDQLSWLLSGLNWMKQKIERYFVCKNQLQYLEKPLKF